MEIFTNTPIAFLLQEAVRQHMTTGGWTFMAGAWVFILVLTFYTFSKILTNKK
jgi:hypothetical protein